MVGLGNPRSVLTKTIFNRWVYVASSPYIRAMHPKTEILPDAQSIAKILSAGWVGQLKIHGHRAQIHISADASQPILAYTRQGKRHSVPLPSGICEILGRRFRPETGWNALDAEWVKGEEKLYLFDVLKWEGKTLRDKTFPERWALLDRNFISPFSTVLPLLRDLPACLKAMQTKGAVEGLVFKSSTSLGFSDTSIVRCRRRD